MLRIRIERALQVMTSERHVAEAERCFGSPRGHCCNFQRMLQPREQEITCSQLHAVVAPGAPQSIEESHGPQRGFVALASQLDELSDGLPRDSRAAQAQSSRNFGVRIATFGDFVNPKSPLSS